MNPDGGVSTTGQPAASATGWSGMTFMASERPLDRFVRGPVSRFLHVEAAGGILLLVAAVAALIWANSPWSASYESFWATEITLEIGDYRLDDHLGGWVNDGLMTIFFFVVGLEIKRELVSGQLRDRKVAAFPAIAAIGGMVVPAAIYLAVAGGGEGGQGWGIPMATDIAFAVGVVALLGNRVPSSLKVFLLTLAIVDDIGAILVIAFFYTSDLEFGWLALAVGGLLLMTLLRQARVWYVPVYAAVGVLVWLATFESGVHATIAGVVMGLMTPARPIQTRDEAEHIVDQLNAVEDLDAEDVRSASFLIRESVPVAERLGHILHPWSSFVIIPIFALANAGIEFSGDAVSDAISSPVTLGVVLGLVVGKTIGVGGAAYLAVRFGFARLPPGINGVHMTGISAVAGIGFTVSLFITNLAFDSPILRDEARIGVVFASVIAAVVGAVILARAGNVTPPDPTLKEPSDPFEDMAGEPA